MLLENPGRCFRFVVRVGDPLRKLRDAVVHQNRNIRRSRSIRSTSHFRDNVDGDESIPSHGRHPSFTAKFPGSTTNHACPFIFKKPGSPQYPDILSYGLPNSFLSQIQPHFPTIASGHRRFQSTVSWLRRDRWRHQA